MSQMTPLFHDRLNVALLGLALLGLLSGIVFWLSGQPELAGIAWAAGVVPVLLALCVEIVRSLAKGEVGLDIVAALSMSAALLFGEPLAAAVVALMYSGGTFLESFAQGRARREMSELLSHLHCTRRSAADPAGRCGPRGWDGRERRRDARPVRADRRVDARPAGAGQNLMSGSTNAGEAFDLRVTLRPFDI